MSRRDVDGKFARQRSVRFLVASWVASLLSVALLCFTAAAVMADVSQFRSCSTNSSLVVHSCGKNSVNLGDLILLGLFVLAAVMAVSLITASWRNTRGKSS